MRSPRSYQRTTGALSFQAVLLLLVIGTIGNALVPTQATAQEKDYKEWLKEQQQEYEQFLSEQDKAFLTFLKKEWADVPVDATATTPVDDKPRRIPRVEPPSSDNFSVPTADSATESPPNPPEEQPSPRLDSFSQDGEEQIPDNMAAAMDELDAATDEQSPTSDPPSPPESDEPPPDEQASDKSVPSEDTPPEQQSSEVPFSETPSSEELPPNSPPPEEEPKTAPLNREASLSFFGVSTAVPYGTASVPRLKGGVGTSSIRRFWKTMAEGPYRPTLDVLQKQREDLKLDDWAYYLYLKDLGTQLYGESASNERVLWTWFMMMKSGYGARVGYRGSEVFLMLPVEGKIFGRPQMHIDGQRYYLMVESMNGSLRTYEGRHEEAEEVLQLDEGTLPDVASERKTRTVEFSFQDQRHSLEVAYNPATVEYLRAYPNVGLPVLLGAGVSSAARSSFEDTLQPLLSGRSPRASLNLLLTFAQFGTDYKRDQDHFGEERYLFPEESLASDYSDCEDRAVLLAYLVRTLLNRKVVGLQWSNHVALAVRAGDGLSVAESDHTVTVEGRMYVYADPTYIGSTLGMRMPIVEDQAPEIIPLGE